MQVVLGSPRSKASLDDFVSQSPLDEIEIVDAEGTAVAYLVPAPQPNDSVYAQFEAVFQSHAEVLRRRSANPTPGVSTKELLTKLHAVTAE